MHYVVTPRARVAFNADVVTTRNTTDKLSNESK